MAAFRTWELTTVAAISKAARPLIKFFSMIYFRRLLRYSYLRLSTGSDSAAANAW